MSNGAYNTLGSEFLVNTTKSGQQTDAAITALATGGFVLCWTDASGSGADSSGSGIKAQIYDANGGLVGSEFLVNSQTAGAQTQASVATLASANFVVTWTDASGVGPDASQLGIKAQMFSASGAKIGSEFLVNTTTNLNQNAPTITNLANGGFVVSWVDASATAPDANSTGVRAQIFDANGAKVGSEFLVNTTTLSAQNYPALTSLSSGGFVATWVDSSGLGGDNAAPGIKAQLFSATGTKIGAEFLVNSTIAGSQDQPTITSLDNGGFVVVWRDQSGVGDTSGSGLKAQIFDANGGKIGAEFQVNTTELNAQDQPIVTAIAGGFAVSWRDNSMLSTDSSGFGIKMQVFDDAGHRLGSEFQVNSSIYGTQEMPTITALANGSLVVAWNDYSGTAGDTDGGIKAQVFTPTTGAISALTLSNTVISEATVEHTAVASIGATGALNASYSYQIVDDSTGGAFTIDGSTLEVGNSLLLDYETAQTATVTVRATDTFGNSFDKVFTISITDSVIESRYSGGTEMLANTAIAGNQQQATVTALSNGHYLLTWSDGSGVGGDTSSYGIKGQIVDSAGNDIGGEFRVNTQTVNSQDSSAVAALASGGFVVTWTDNSGVGGDPSSSGIKAQIFDANGIAVGSEFLVNQTTDGAQKMPSVAALSSGGFVVTWTDNSLQGGDTSVSSVKAQLYDASGAKVGSEFLVNTNTANGQDTPVVASLSGGGFVVSWHDSSQIGGDPNKDAVKAQIYDASGARVGSEFLVNTQTASNQQQETITGLASGGFVVAWADASGKGGDADNYGIKFQIYDAAGNKVGVETLANSTTAGAQLAPSVAALSDGSFIVSWADYSGQGSEMGTAGIKAQIFAADGTKIGGEFLVNTQALGSQTDPAVIGNDHGGFAIAWTDFSGQGGDDSGTSIKFKLFDPLGSQGGPPPLVATADTLTGTEDIVSIYSGATLLANDVDAAGQPLTLQSISAVSGGTVSLDANGAITFTPFANFSGAALFTYVVTDTDGHSATGRVTINVAPVNDAPTANDDHITVSEDGSVIPGSSLLANDVDPDLGDTLTIHLNAATSAAGAQISITNGIISYAPGSLFQSLAAGQTATDSFTYTIVDSDGLNSTATAYLTVTGANDAPTAITLAGSAVDENAANGTVVGTVSAQDVDRGDTLTYSLTNTAGGRFAIDAHTGVISVANGTLLDYETAQSQTIVARATDSSGAYVESSYTIAINNLPEPKSWTGDNGVNVFTASSNDLWTINGLGGNDVLTGNASHDVIYGGAGADTLDGAGGADTLAGGIGNDIYYVDNVGDQVIENTGEGTDTVYASVSYTLGPDIENLIQTGTLDLSFVGNDLANTVTGNSGNNEMHGGLGGDLLTGNDGNDTLYGEGGSDFLQGGNGNDTLIGGAGADELTGGAGNDMFVFDSLTTSADRDKVKDFTPGEDIMALSKAVFTAFANLPAGGLPASAFINGTQALTADQHIIYQQSTGNLYYDPDGVGGQAQIQIALLSTKPVLTADHFTIIA
ncbi:beta strand repeat-containing protein [Flavisphingomonas formosensis]|uniref:beta strand repeat-containing protein n=1 Tax=Flavisphingomonas formosensis TaxID=861534 RepID=UPI0012F83561|nr:Ig-like domain-containing protein [Sphingomonas formosensis]